MLRFNSVLLLILLWLIPIEYSHGQLFESGYYFEDGFVSSEERKEAWDKAKESIAEALRGEFPEVNESVSGTFDGLESQWHDLNFLEQAAVVIASGTLFSELSDDEDLGDLPKINLSVFDEEFQVYQTDAGKWVLKTEIEINDVGVGSDLAILGKWNVSVPFSDALEAQLGGTLKSKLLLESGEFLEPSSSIHAELKWNLDEHENAALKIEFTNGSVSISGTWKRRF